MKLNKMTQEQLDIVTKVVEKESGTILVSSIMTGFLGGLFGLGFGLIFLGFLQALGLSIVSGVSIMSFTAVYIIYGPVLKKAIKEIEKSQSE